MSVKSDLTDQELFGRVLPLAPSVATMRRSCIVCGLTYVRAVTVNHFCCEPCAADPDSARLALEVTLARIDTEGEALTEAWLAEQAALPDDVAERWTALVQARQLADERYERATTGPQSIAMTADDIADAVAAATAHRARIATKIARTRKEPGNPLAILLIKDASYRRRRDALTREQADVRLALQHLAIAAGDEPPY